jgi:hypothetical protein
MAGNDTPNPMLGEAALFMDQGVEPGVEVMPFGAPHDVDPFELTEEIVEGFALFAGALINAVGHGERTQREAASSIRSQGGALALNGSLSDEQKRRIHVLSHEAINAIDPYFGYSDAGHA